MSHWFCTNTLDVEVYSNFGEGYWAQAKYLVHGRDDVYWVNTVEEVVQIIQSNLELIERKEND